jgi:peptidoglycan/xylan/chitin deacetylase (PgdA/CDA1 family)
MDQCKEDRHMIKLFFYSVLIAALSITIFVTIPAYADTMGSVAVTLTYTNGDTADYYPASLKIYQDFNQTPYKEIVSLSGNPFNIVSLPIGHKYKIEAYANGEYASTQYVDLQQSHQDTTIILPLSGGIRVTVVYNDGLTPISNSTVFVKSQDNKIWAHSLTDPNGKTTRFWLEPTVLENEHYIIDVKVGNNLTYTQSPIVLRPGVPQEVKVVTSWPPLINSLITVNVMDLQLHKVSSTQGKFIVNLLDSNQNKIAQSPVTSRGQAYFSNLKIGDYILQVIRTDDNSEWSTSRITMDGSILSFDVVENQKTVSPQPVIPTPQPVIPTPQPVIPTPQPVIPTPQPVIPTPQPVISKINATNCNCVVFRLDNVQDYWLDNVQSKVIDTFYKNNASLTIGIIGGAFGTDTKLEEAIKPKVQSGIIDVGINGWNFEDFTSSNETQQAQLLQYSKNKISEIFGVSPSVFIPPYGKFNNDTFYAMMDNHIYFISGNLESLIPPSGANKIYYYPPTVFTGMNSEGNTTQIITNDMILSNIQKNIQANGYAIVTINFQDYAQNNGTVKVNMPDNEKILKLQSLIDAVRSSGYRIITVKDISNSPSVPEFGYLTTITLVISIMAAITVLPRIKTK